MILVLAFVIGYTRVYVCVLVLLLLGARVVRACVLVLFVIGYTCLFMRACMCVCVCVVRN